MPRRRDVWRIDRPGSLARLTHRSEELPDAAAGQAQIAVKAIGLNFADLFACLGLYSATPKGSFIPGLEFAGVVEAIGSLPSATDRGHTFQVGDSVVGLTRFGAYATSVNADVRYLRAIPSGWSFAEAAALPVQGLTAWYGLVQCGGLRRNSVLLLQSAAGGVGLQALSIAAAIGARVVAAVGSEAKRQWLIEHRGLHRDQIIVRNRRTFGADLDRALEMMGAEGFDVVFDAVAGPFLRPSYNRLRPEGRFVLYGASDFMTRGNRVNYARLALRYLLRPRLDPLSMVSGNRSLMAFNLIWLWDRLERFTHTADALAALITAPPFVGARFPFEDAPAAMRHLQSGASIGKVVLDVT